MPGLQTLALSVVAGARRALGGRRPLRLVAPAGAHGVQGRRRALGARHRRGRSRPTAARSTPPPAMSAPASRSARLKGGLPLAMEVRRRPGAAGRPSTPTTWSGRSRWSARRSPRPPTRPTTWCSTWPRPPPSPASRWAGRSSATPRPVVAPASRDTLGACRAGLYAPDRLVVSAAGAVDEDELLALAERAVRRRCGRAEPPGRPAAAASPAAALAEPRRWSRRTSVLLLPGAGRARPRLFRPAPVRRGARRRHVLAPVPGGAREAAAWPTPSTPTPTPTPMPACWASTPAARPRTPLRPRGWWPRRSSSPPGSSPPSWPAPRPS